MAIVQKQDSNVTGLRFAEEQSLKVLPGTPVWTPLEPNSYDNFGGEITTVPRNPIIDTRQRQKGVTTDLDASGGFQNDVTQTNMQSILQGFMFADLRPKGEENPTSATVQAGDDTYEMASTTGFLVGAIVNASGFTNAANNGIKDVTAVVADTSIAVTQVLVTESSPPTAAQVVVVGHTGAAGDIDVDASGTFPTLTSTVLDFTTLGLIPGEFIFVGGDAAANKFINAVNNGFARIRTIAANVLTLDKTAGTMVTEASTTETIKLYFGRVLKNENTAALIKRRTYSLERSLGAPDDALPAQVQGEYLDGAVPSTWQLNIATADKVTADLNFVALDNVQVTGATGLRSGTRPALVSEDAFNTSSDFSRFKMNIVSTTDSNPTALFAFISEMTLSIDNSLNVNKAISVLGGFEVTAGQFVVDGSMTAYFADVTAVTAVRNNSDVTVDMAMVRGVAGSKTGIVIDIPLIALGDARLNVEQDEPITLPLTIPAAADPTLNHTLLFTFYDFLPDAADT